MMNWLVKWGIKKYVLSFINDVLAARKDSVAKARAIVRKAIEKVRAILDYLTSLEAKLLDNKITDDEADAIVAESTRLGEQLVK